MLYARDVEMDPLELARLQARACFVHDDEDRLIAINDIGSGAPPWVLIVRTAAGSLVRFRAGAPSGLVEEAERFAAALPPLDEDTCAPGGTLDALTGLVARHVPITRRSAGPAYVFEASGVPAIGAMELYPANAVLLHPELAAWGPELRQRKPCFGVFRGGQAIAICASARRTPEAAEAGVETVAAFRGQGAAGLAAASWGDAVLASGRVAFYSTSWENAASQSVAAKLGLRYFAEDLHVT